MADNMTPEKKGIPIVAKVGAAIGAAALTGAIVYGVTRPPETQSVVPPTPSAAAASPTPKETPTVAPTVKTAEPTPSKTPEVKAVECLVLPKEVCSQAELVLVKNDKGEVNLYAGLNPDPGTPLSSAIDGQMSKVNLPGSGPSRGVFLTILNPDNREVGSYNFTGDIDSPGTGRNIKAGETFGKMGNSGVKSFDRWSLLVNISKIDPATNRPVTDEEKMRKLFPEMFTKPAMEVSYEGSSGPLVISPVFYGTPQPGKP